MRSKDASKKANAKPMSELIFAASMYFSRHSAADLSKSVLCEQMANTNVKSGQVEAMYARRTLWETNNDQLAFSTEIVPRLAMWSSCWSVVEVFVQETTAALNRKGGDSERNLASLLSKYFDSRFFLSINLMFPTFSVSSVWRQVILLPSFAESSLRMMASV